MLVAIAVPPEASETERERLFELLRRSYAEAAGDTEQTSTPYAIACWPASSIQPPHETPC